jgi:hypothetical protein
MCGTCRIRHASLMHLSAPLLACRQLAQHVGYLITAVVTDNSWYMLRLHVWMFSLLLLLLDSINADVGVASSSQPVLPEAYWVI